MREARQGIGAQGAVSRRTWLHGVGLGALAAGFGGVEASATPSPAAVVTVEMFSPAGEDLGAQAVSKVVRTPAEWRSRLSAGDFMVTRRAGTERAYSGRSWNQHASGLYRCICCDTALFDSATKFDSHTGWPSFWQPIAAANVVQNNDNSFGMQRNEVACVRCDAHLGHVFDDGPQPTGLRYCMNSAAMRFVAKA